MKMPVITFIYDVNLKKESQKNKEQNNMMIKKTLEYICNIISTKETHSFR